MLGSAVVQNITFAFILSYRSIVGGFPLVDFSPCLLMCRCPIVVFLNFSICLLIIFSVRHVHIFRKTCLIVLSRLAIVGLKSAAWKYCASSGFDVCARTLFVTAPDC